jgi:S1-C subfamily serine protease
MGETSADNGVTVIGLTPGGPAETAGIQKGDVLTGVNGRIFVGADDAAGTAIIKEEISNLEPGDEVEILYRRDGEDQSVIVTTQAREPLTVHSMIRIPDAPQISEQVLRIIEQVEIPQIDVEVLEEKLAIIEEKLIDGEWSFGGPHYNIQFAPGAEFTYEEFSDLASSAIDNTMVWFGGSSYAQGLQFAAMNDDLGVYFDTPEGVLVLRAKADNTLELRSGDVILEINGNAVHQPADVMRELRFVEDNSNAELLLMRNRNLESLVITLPEKQIHKFEFHIAPEAKN